MNSSWFAFQFSYLYNPLDILLLQAEIMWQEILKFLFFSQAKLSERSITPKRIQPYKTCLLSVVFHKCCRILICWMQISGMFKSCCAKKYSRGGLDFWWQGLMYACLSAHHTAWAQGSWWSSVRRVSVIDVLDWLYFPIARQSPRTDSLSLEI